MELTLGSRSAELGLSTVPGCLPSSSRFSGTLSSGPHCLKTASLSLEAWESDRIRNLLGRKLAFSLVPRLVNG